MRLFLGIVATLILVSGFAPSAFAENAAADCSPITLDSPGGTMESVVSNTPMIRQSGNSCSFHVAGEMYDAWRYKTGSNSPQLSSPLELEMRINTQDGMSFINGGTIRGNLAEWRKNGSCPRLSYDPKTGIDLDEHYFTQFAEDFLTLRAGLKKNPDPTASVQTLRNEILDFAIHFHTYLLNDRVSTDRLTYFFTQDDFVSFMNEMMLIHCDDSAKIRVHKNYGIVSISDPNGSAANRAYLMNQEINRELNRGIANAWPIGIEFCSDVLLHGKKSASLTYKDSQCGPHASLIIGRRTNPQTGACQFLVRNSWSPTTKYSSEWEKIPGKDHVWVDADALSKSIQLITRFAE